MKRWFQLSIMVMSWVTGANEKVRSLCGLCHGWPQLSTRWDLEPSRRQVLCMPGGLLRCEYMLTVGETIPWDGILGCMKRRNWAVLWFHFSQLHGNGSNVTSSSRSWCLVFPIMNDGLYSWAVSQNTPRAAFGGYFIIAIRKVINIPSDERKWSRSGCEIQSLMLPLLREWGEPQIVSKHHILQSGWVKTDTKCRKEVAWEAPFLLTTCDLMDPSLGQPENFPDQKATPFPIAWLSVDIVPANTQKPSWYSKRDLPFPSHFIASCELSKTL